MKMVIVAMSALLAVAAVPCRAASVEHARALIAQARDELEAVLEEEDSSADERSAALSLLKQLNGEQQADAAPTPPSQSGELHLSSCTPWIVMDNLTKPSIMEADVCDGGGMVINAQWKRAPAPCVRGPRVL